MIRSFSFVTAGVAALALAGVANADSDLIRLDGKGEDAQVQETRYYGGGYRGGFYGRGSWGWGGYRGYGWGGHGWGGYGWGHRGFYRPYVGVGIGLGFGYSNWYGGGYGGYYAPSYYSPYYSSYYISPCATNVTPTAVTGTTLILGSSPNMPATQIPGDGTFPYDGGPRDGYVAPPPMSPAPAGSPVRPTLPRDGRLVSVPAANNYQFLAFGEQPAESPPVRVAPRAAETLRISYPAYGEPMPSFSAGTTLYTTVLR